MAVICNDLRSFCVRVYIVNVSLIASNTYRFVLVRTYRSRCLLQTTQMYILVYNHAVQIFGMSFTYYLYRKFTLRMI